MKSNNSFLDSDFTVPSLGMIEIAIETVVISGFLFLYAAKYSLPYLLRRTGANKT